jgi:hypothetical protein
LIGHGRNTAPVQIWLQKETIGPAQSLTLATQPVAAQLADPGTQRTVELWRVRRNDREVYSREYPVPISAETVTTRPRFSTVPASITVDNLLQQ